MREHCLSLRFSEQVQRCHRSGEDVGEMHFVQLEKAAMMKES